jgi:integrase
MTPSVLPVCIRNGGESQIAAGLMRKAAGDGLHGLRHYFATLLIHNGASVKTVQLALGHAPTITLNTYAHEWPDALDRTRALVDPALGRPTTGGAESG